MRGLSCCALVLAVLGLWLGTSAGRSPAASLDVPGITHSVVAAVGHVAARTVPPDVAALPAELSLVAMASAWVLITRRRVAHPVRVRAERRHERAPPGGTRP